MKLNVKQLAVFGLGVVLVTALAGCNDDLDDVNREFEQHKTEVAAKVHKSEPMVLKSTDNKKETKQEKKKKTVVRTTVKY